MIEIRLGSKNKEKKSKRQFSKTLALLVLINTFIISMYTLYLCKLCIELNYTGSLPLFICINRTCYWFMWSCTLQIL